MTFVTYDLTTQKLFSVQYANNLYYTVGKHLSNSNAFIGSKINLSIMHNTGIGIAVNPSDNLALDVLNYGISSDGSISPTVLTTPTINTGSLSAGSPGTYTQSGSGIFGPEYVYGRGQKAVTIEHSYTGSVALTLPCVISGGTSISYAVAQATTGATLPTWIALDSANEMLTVTGSPSSGTSYQFGVAVTGNSQVFTYDVSYFKPLRSCICSFLNFVFSKEISKN